MGRGKVGRGGHSKRDERVWGKGWKGFEERKKKEAGEARRGGGRPAKVKESKNLESHSKRSVKVDSGYLERRVRIPPR